MPKWAAFSLLFPLLDIEIRLVLERLNCDACRNRVVLMFFGGAFCSLLHLGIEVDLRAQPKRNRVLRLQIG